MMNQHVCRCCLIENPTFTYNIFDDGQVFMDLHECIPNLNLQRDDGLPEIICEQCKQVISEVLEFRRKCMETDQELRKRYDDTNKAIEVALGSGLMDMDQIEEQVNTMLMENFDVETKQSSDDADIHTSSKFDALEMTIMDDLLLDDCTFSSLPTSSSDTSDAAVMSELLNEVLKDPTFLADELTLPNTVKNIREDNSLFALQESKENTKTTAQKLQANDHSLMQVTKNVKKKSPKSLHPCPECEKKFTRNFQLKLHLISVHNLGDGLQYQCNDCQKTFASRHSLSYHYKSIHSNERPFACLHCQRCFILRSQLASHLRTHTGDAKPRIFKCLECEKCWPTKSDLRTHMRSHKPDEQRPYKCEYCSKRFYTRGHLASHILVHTGEKPFACIYCQKSYQSVGNLNNHMVRRHKAELMGIQSDVVPS